tara:strand:- start:1087 stop:1983 length:897 start_codon:yes stop_codon:yes gene_type:complete
MGKNWIQSVDKEMKKKGTVGAFTKQAKKAGMSVHDFAEEVKRNPEDYSSTTRKRATLALTFERIGKRRKERDAVKMAHGGKTQGYDARENESLGMRTGKESSKKQSRKARREDSYGKWGKRGMEDRDGQMINRSMGKGGKTQGYRDRENESLGMRTGKESSKKQSMKARREDSYGKWGKRDSEGRDITLAKGGTLSEKAVKKNFIRRDRYDKLKQEKADLRKDLRTKGADCAEDIKVMKKDIGKKIAKRIDQVERRKDKECDSNIIAPGNKGKIKEENQTYLLAGIAGILFGAFLGKR